MSKFPVSFLAVLLVSLAACVTDETPVAPPMVVPIVTAKTDTVGTASVANSTDGLFITVTAGTGWELTETRMAIARSAAGIPQKKGKASLEKFILKRKGKPATQEMKFVLPLTVDPGTPLYIALHADVRQAKLPKGPGKQNGSHDDDDDDDDDDDCDDDQKKESGWAQGTAFPGNDGSMYFVYTVMAPAPPTLAGLYTTYPQESWGGVPQAGNAASYLSDNFSRAFLGGLTIGHTDGFTVRFTSAQAVLNFLPQTGTPAALTRSSVDPINLGNPLAGSVLALALNVGFDNFDSTFSTGTVALEALVVADPDSRFAGLTVAEVLSIAHLALAGRNPTALSLDDIHDAVSRINLNFENGTSDLNFLALPPP